MKSFLASVVVQNAVLSIFLSYLFLRSYSQHMQTKLSQQRPFTTSRYCDTRFLQHAKQADYRIKVVFYIPSKKSLHCMHLGRILFTLRNLKCDFIVVIK